jgi:two-component system CheB/CheR fusion protein
MSMASADVGTETPKAYPPVVCLGASAGGLRALEGFFHKMPIDSGCAFVVVQHLSPDFPSLMDDLLGRQTRLAIKRVEDGLALTPDTIHLIPPGKLMTIEGERLRLVDRAGDRPAELPINIFLRSLARHAGQRAVAIILSGTGSDGADGAAEIRQVGGLVLAQDPDTAEFDGMPRSVISRHLADQVLAPPDMPRVILSWRKDPASQLRDPSSSMRIAGSEAEEGSAEPEGEFGSILERLRRAYGLDFANYKSTTVRRRIERRMLIGKFQEMDRYALELEARPAELDALYHDMLIGVTEFFRDPEVYASLRERVYSPLLARKGREELRLWVAGCATGEEAYSHAILIDEVARSTGFTGRVAIFATDAHRASLETASAGLYPSERLQHLGSERIARYFREEKDGRYRVSPELRGRVVFAPHDLLCDPPFMKLDLVSCRNLLIYLEVPAQERVLSLLHYGLRREGVMLLGTSESLGRLGDEFETLDAKNRLYRKIRESRLPTELRGPRVTRPSPLNRPVVVATPLTGSLPRGLLQAYEHLLAEHLPPGFIISSDGEILHYIGPATNYLLPIAGRAQDNILVRAHGDLRLALSILIPKALHDKQAVESRGVRVQSPGSEQSELVDLLVHPMPTDRSGVCALHISLRSARPAAPLPNPISPTVERPEFASHEALLRRVADLELELVSTKESLQATVEELQTANEELQATNEEMLATNEELQSTNEELHSVNEELHTVNDEFERKNTELARINADHESLLGTIDAGTLFLDGQLRIRKFNAAIGQIFRLLPQDLGRPIEHIAYHLDDQAGMIDDVREVLQSGQPREGEVRTRDGHWLLKRILPHRHGVSEEAGVVLTFTRIDLIKSMQAKLDLAMSSSRLVWWEWDLSSGRLITHSGGPCILGYQLGELTPHADTWLSLTHPEDLARLRASLDDCVSGETGFWECEHRYRDARGAWRWVLEKGRVTERDSSGRALRMLGTTQDIDARHATETEIAKLSHAIAQVEVSVVITDVSGIIEYVNPHFTRITGYTAPEVVGRSPRILKSGLVPETTFVELWSTIAGGEHWRGELINRRKDGSVLHERVSISPIKDSSGRITHYIGMQEDITQQRAEEEKRAQLEHQLAQSQKMETLGTLAGGIAHDFNNLLTSILGNADIVRGNLPSGDQSIESIRQIEQAGRRAADLVRRILAFSRHHPPGRNLLSPGRLFAEALPMLRASLPATIELRFHDESEGRAVLGDETQLQQILLNLCTNAAQAIAPQSGYVEIGLGRVEITTSLPVQAGELPPGRYLRLLVADTGSGMSPSVVERIFEPFFTTKGIGEGTGLGLAIVHNIVVSHRGAIIVRSEPGHGSAFHVYLPEAGLSAPGDPGRETFLDLAPNRPEGRPIRAAVIDDEPDIVALTTVALARAGYVPEAHPSAEACMHAFRADPATADVIITDQTMPGMTGIELAQALREDGIRVPIVLVSGYTRVVDQTLLDRLGRIVFLAKPYDIGNLLAEIQGLLRKP